MDLNENLKGISDETIRYVTLRLNDFKFNGAHRQTIFVVNKGVKVNEVEKFSRFDVVAVENKELVTSTIFIYHTVECTTSRE